MVRRRIGALLGAAAMALVVVACSKSDPGITTAVKTKLAADSTVKAYLINVDTKDGVVTLAGNVDTDAAKGRAVELARATTGVRDVRDELTVTPPAAATSGVGEPGVSAVVDDASITAAVKTKFIADPAISGLSIDVDTKDNVVTLSGGVRSDAERKQAVEIAEKTNGVKSVVDHLKIEKKQ